MEFGCDLHLSNFDETDVGSYLVTFVKHEIKTMFVRHTGYGKLFTSGELASLGLAWAGASRQAHKVSSRQMSQLP